jgi:pSer/pThr/pTyr-binding forkhead associated (FHA) protein
LNQSEIRKRLLLRERGSSHGGFIPKHEIRFHSCELPWVLVLRSSNNGERPMKLSLLVTDGIHAGEVIAIEGVSLFVGRGPNCQVRPNSPAVSPCHCALLVRDDRVFLRDLGSKTGTFLNHRQLRGEIELQDGDMLRVGPLTFVVQIGSDDPLPPIPLATDEPPAEQALSALDDVVDLTRIDETQGPSAADTQVVPGLEPYPEPTSGTNGSWRAAEEDYSAPTLPPVTPVNELAAAASMTSSGPAPNRSRLTHVIRTAAPRRPPT